MVLVSYRVAALTEFLVKVAVGSTNLAAILNMVLCHKMYVNFVFLGYAKNVERFSSSFVFID